MKKLLQALLPVALAASAFGAIAADEYPSKPVTIIVPFAAGGPTDKVARDLAEALRKPLGTTVIVDNAAGAGGAIGANKVAKAQPDGYTLLLHHIGMATMPTLVPNIPSKVESDFEYVGMINDVASPLASAVDPFRPAAMAVDVEAGDRAAVIDLIGPVTVPVDELIRLAALPPAIVHTVLLELELAGRLDRHAGGRVSLIG